MTPPCLGTPAQFWNVFHAEPVVWFVGSFISVWEPSVLQSAYALTSGVVAALASGTEIDAILVIGSPLVAAWRGGGVVLDDGNRQPHDPRTHGFADARAWAETWTAETGGASGS